jgi:hypothetical protein
VIYAYLSEGGKKLMAILVGIVSIVVNVAVSFMTDGNWKTAGTGLTQIYWDHVNGRSCSPRQASPLRPGRAFRFNWSAGRSGVGAEGLPVF